MALANAPILAFNRGIVDERALSRVDLRRLAWSAETQTNWMPRALGSMSVRPGFEYIGSTSGNAVARHIEFIKRTVSDQAIIEVTDQALRVLVDEAAVTRASVSSAVTNGAFTSNVNDWTDSDESGATSAWATGGYLSLIGTKFNAARRRQEVTVSVGDQGTEHALRIVIERGPVTLKVGSTAGGDDYISETSLGTGAHSLAFTPTGNFHIELSNRAQTAGLVDSVAVEGSGAMEIPTPWTESDLPNLRWAQSGDVLFVACDGFQQRRIERRGTRSWSIVKYEPADGPFRTLNITPTKLTPSATTGDITLTSSLPLFKSGHVGGLFRLTSIGQTVDIDVTAESQFSDAIRVIGVGNSRQFTITVSGTWSATVTLQRSVDEVGSWTDVTTYTANQAGVTFDDGLDNQIIYYRIGVDTGDYTSGTAECNLSYSGGGISGVVRVTGYTSSTSVSAAVLVPLGGTTASDDWSEGTWSDYRGYPTAVAFYEGRLWWTGRDKIIGSVSDAFESFDDEIEGDSAPINRSLGSGPIDFINWLVPADRLLVGSEGAEIAARSSSFDEPLTPTNFNLKDSATLGSAGIDAVKIDKRVVFALRDLRGIFKLQQGTSLDYEPEDLTLLAPRICAPGVSQISVQRRPDTRIHCRLSDGTVSVLLFHPSEDLQCWVKVETDGVVEDILVMPGSSEDTVYYTVKRTIDGQTKRYLEKMALEADCSIFTTTYSGVSATVLAAEYADGTVLTARDADGVKIENVTVSNKSVTLSSGVTYARLTPSLCKLADSFLVYTGSATSTITGLDHLEGETVVVWADGKSLDDANGNVATFTVSSGSIALTDGGSSVSVEQAVVGLAYTPQFKGARSALDVNIGYALGQQARVSSLSLVGHNMHSKGVKFGPSFDDLDNLPTIVAGRTIQSDEVFRNYIFQSNIFPGNTSNDERVCIEGVVPRPATITAAIAGTDVDERAP